MARTEATAAVLELIERGGTTLDVDLVARASRQPGHLPGLAPSAERWRSKVLDTPNGDRVVVEVSLDGAAAPGDALIAKRYGDDTGAFTFRVMAAITEALRGSEAGPLAVPEPLSYQTGRRCLIQRRAPGVPLPLILDRGECGPALRLAGEALAELHALDLPVGEAKSMGEHLVELIRPHPLALARQLPGRRARIEALCIAIEAAAMRFRGTFHPRPLHRDFHPGQLLIDGSRAWLLDWDLYAKGDPALDVGNFLMCLETRCPAVTASHAFLDGYLCRAAPDVEARIPLYTGLGYLRRASKHFRLARPGWPARTDAMLEQAERCLAGGLVKGGAHP